MPIVQNWEDWDEVEEKLQNEQSKRKTNGKNKTKKEKVKNDNYPKTKANNKNNS